MIAFLFSLLQKISFSRFSSLIFSSSYPSTHMVIQPCLLKVWQNFLLSLRIWHLKFCRSYLINWLVSERLGFSNFGKQTQFFSFRFIRFLQFISQNWHWVLLKDSIQPYCLIFNVMEYMVLLLIRILYLRNIFITKWKIYTSYKQKICAYRFCIRHQNCFFSLSLIHFHFTVLIYWS